VGFLFRCILLQQYRTRIARQHPKLHDVPVYFPAYAAVPNYTVCLVTETIVYEQLAQGRTLRIYNKEKRSMIYDRLCRGWD